MAASKPSSIQFTVGRRATRADIPRLCTTLRAQLLEDRVDVVICDVGALVDPDAESVDTLARMQLICRRLGCQLHLEHVSRELSELIDFMGLRGPLTSSGSC